MPNFVLTKPGVDCMEFFRISIFLEGLLFFLTLLGKIDELIKTSDLPI